MDSSSLKNKLIVRPVAQHERDLWIRLCNEHHYLGYKGSFGYSILYCACIGDEWVALLSWAACAFRLKSRDDLIGWSPALREVRSNLIVNNNRFVILPSHHKTPNLASTILAQNTSLLPEDWYVRFLISIPPDNYNIGVPSDMLAGAPTLDPSETEADDTVIPRPIVELSETKRPRNLGKARGRNAAKNSASQTTRRCHAAKGRYRCMKSVHYNRYREALSRDNLGEIVT